MPQMEYGLSSYERAEGDLPALPVLNMYAEEAPTEERGVMLQSRKGLADRAANMGTGPVKALFLRDLVLGSKLYGLSAGALYEETAKVGNIDGSGPASMAGNEIGLMATQGQSLYFYDGATLAAVATPDGAPVAHVTTGGSRYWIVRKDTGKLYWTDALESDVDALDFATAESLPDRLLQTLWIDGAPILFGSESVEFWQQTGNAALPIKPLINMVFETGLKATGCATGLGSSFAFVSNRNQVHYGSEENVISNPGLEARIEESATCSLFRFYISGTEFLALRIDDETQVWNKRTGTWHEFASYGQTNWIPQCYAAGVFGSAIDGRTLAWADDYADLGGQLERRIRAGFPMDSGAVQVANVQVRVNSGQTPYLQGDYAEPEIELRISRNTGKTFGAWKQTNLGKQGEYRELVQWRALGQASRPGFICEIRVTDPVPLRISGVLINEPYGGR